MTQARNLPKIQALCPWVAGKTGRLAYGLDDGTGMALHGGSMAGGKA